MIDRGHRGCVEAALAHEAGARTPVNNFAIVTAARSAGMTVDEARWRPEVSATVSIDYALKTRSDFVKPILDSQAPFADLGAEVSFPEDDYGYIRSHLVKDAEDVDSLAFFDPRAAEECPFFSKIFVEGLEATAAALPEDLHVCGLSWGPFTTAGLLMGAEQMLMATFMDRDMVRSLVDKSAGFVLDMQAAMLEAGATVIWMADPTSSGDMISPGMFEDLSFGAIKSVMEGAKAASGAPAFLHICGDTTGILPMIPDTGTDCFSFDHAVDIAAAKGLAGKRVALMGNIDPVKLIMDGSPEAVARECARMIGIAGTEGGYVIAPGCETPQSSPDANVEAMGRAGTEYWLGNGR
ncbi:MAG: uroporphyrinogen decarboxylase family protein [Candidatus Methanoplasma sp.]|jgi:uroporphyrinogen decarboxylase|nr:uroporphyrinogen decarboxylase family protein [Candidatus Methanoplasma sp.]